MYMKAVFFCEEIPPLAVRPVMLLIFSNRATVTRLELVILEKLAS